MTRQKSLKGLLLFLLIGIVLISGCATKSGPPSFASTDLEEGVSIPHPDQIRKEADAICVFPVVFPPELLVECVGTGFKGTWKLLSIDMRDPAKKLIESFVYFKKDPFYEKTPWGLPLLEAVVLGERTINESYLHVLANRDGMVWLFSPLGEVYSEEDGYDSKKFEEDPKYRVEIFEKIGMNVLDIEDFFKVLHLSEGLSFGEIKIDSPAWEKFEKNRRASMPYEYIMPGGKIVASAHKKEQIQALIRINPRLNGWQRFLERTNLPVADPKTMALVGISQLLNHSFQELTAVPEFKGFSANSETKRKVLANQFKFLVEEQHRQP